MWNQYYLNLIEFISNEDDNSITQFLEQRVFFDRGLREACYPLPQLETKKERNKRFLKEKASFFLCEKSSGFFFFEPRFYLPNQHRNAVGPSKIDINSAKSIN